MKRGTLLLLAACLLACNRAPRETKVEAPRYSSLDAFPALGPARPAARGIVVHRVAIAHATHTDRLWIYLPEKPKGTPMPAVFIAPAGVPPFVGNAYGEDHGLLKDPEHLPYVRAGFAVVAYDLDGALANPDDVTFEQVQTAATAFQNADAGMLNARHAIDYALKMVPAIDPKRLYSAGHSSAGRVSLLLAETDPRIAACVAYAPVTDPERRAFEIAADAAQYLESNVDGFRDFLKKTSPVQQAAQLRCPLFLFHAADDSRISIAESEAFAELVKKTNPRVTFVRAASGDHYDSMVEEGVPQAIEWLEKVTATTAGSPAAAP